MVAFLGSVPVGTRARGQLRSSTCRLAKGDLDLQLYLVADPTAVPKDGPTLVDLVEQSVQNGVSVVQLRDKNSSTREMLALARSIRNVTRKHGIPFLVNDRVDIALASEADGVHLGQDDLPIQDARRLLGGDAIIGISAGIPEEAIAAQADKADYIGVGAVYSTASKPDAGPPIGLEGLSRIILSCDLPVVAIGGISEETANACAFAGANGVAVISAILGDSNPAKAASRLREAFSESIGA